jgi:hypothetical protein
MFDYIFSTYLRDVTEYSKVEHVSLERRMTTAYPAVGDTYVKLDDEDMYSS